LDTAESLLTFRLFSLVSSGRFRKVSVED